MVVSLHQTSGPAPGSVPPLTMSYDTTLFIAVLLLAFCVYYPIMKIARRDMAARSNQGMGNTTILMILMVPILGPLLYLLFRRSFKVD